MPDPGRRTLALALALTPGIGGKTVSRTLARMDLLGTSIREFLGCGELALKEEFRFTAGQAIRWMSLKTDQLSAASELEKELDARGILMLTAADAGYPTMLEEFSSDPPGVLFLAGNHRLLAAATFTVLSSRSSSPNALEMIESLVSEAVLNGEVLVTGHDTPEYQRAAVVPLRWGAPRILCFDQGFYGALGEDLRQEPFRTARLWRYEFDLRTDLALSTVPPSNGYIKGANAKRDQLIAALSKRLDFIAINPGGNMEKLARTALKAGRPVRISDAHLGAREWTRYGAKMLEL